VPMPLAKIHVHEGRYDEARLIKLGDAVQAALEDALGIPSEDYFRIYHVLPSNRYVHTPGFLGLTYTDNLIMLEITFIAGRNRDARLALLKAVNERVVSALGISPDDLAIMVYETAGENVSFGRGEAQRAHIGAAA
jgi:phenylpyruvate tautomerase PptA (4-oxalocrotonate tautomerase family)